MPEKRRFKRTDFETGGTLWVKGVSMPFTLIDVSLKGALINPREPEKIATGESATIHIQLAQGDVAIRAEGTCIHREYNYLGFRFTMIDADGMAHLRRLLELNLGDAAEVDHELSFLADDHAAPSDS
ncbi:MAG: PilZ domain-containing protein [Spirochaetota bacterium]